MAKSKIDPYEYVNRYYNLTVRVGQRVKMQGKPGVVVKPNGSTAHVMVRFDGHKHAAPCHPTWEMEYLEEAS